MTTRRERPGQRQFSMYLPVDTYKAFRRYAFDRERPMAEFIREAIEELLLENEKQEAKSA